MGTFQVVPFIVLVGAVVCYGVLYFIGFWDNKEENDNASVASSLVLTEKNKQMWNADAVEQIQSSIQLIFLEHEWRLVYAYQNITPFPVKKLSAEFSLLDKDGNEIGREKGNPKGREILCKPGEKLILFTSLPKEKMRNLETLDSLKVVETELLDFATTSETTTATTE
jgi:hypothetical protein